MSVTKYSNIVFCNTHNNTKVLLSRKGTPINPEGKFKLTHCANLDTISDTSLANVSKIMPVEDTLYVVRYVDYDFANDFVTCEGEYVQWVTIENDINFDIVDENAAFAAISIVYQH